MARVDVIVPFYNTPIRFVREALQGLLAQTIPDWLALVINDGSNATSSRELEELLNELNDSRFNCIHTDNQGLAAARNNGIRAGQSPFIALLDSDDVFYPHRLEHGCTALSDDTDVDMVHAAVDLILPDGTVKENPPRDLDLPPDRPGQFRKLLQSNYINGVTTTFRRRAAEDVGFYDPEFDALEDKEFYLRMLLRGKSFRYHRKVVGKYRLHQANMSKNIDKMTRGRRRLITKVERELSDHPLVEASQWQKLRRDMEYHIQHEIAHAKLEQGSPEQALAALRFSAAGVSLTTLRLKLQSCYRMLRK